MGTTNTTDALSVTELPGRGSTLRTWVIADRDADDQDVVTVVEVIELSDGRRLVEVAHRERHDAGYREDSGGPSREPVLFRAAEVLVLAKVLLQADALAAGLVGEVVSADARRRHRGELAA